jgi:hypothetical protein
MAASYQTGATTSPTDLLQTLVTWLAAQGWTILQSEAAEFGWRAHLSKSGSLNVNLRAAENERLWPTGTGGYHDLGTGGFGLGLFLSTEWDGGLFWHEQPGSPVRPVALSVSGCGMNLPEGPVSAYHFFDDGNDHITVVIERTPGIYCHMGWGPALERPSLPEPFPYFFASSSTKLNTAMPSDMPAGNRHGIDLTAFPPMSHTDEDYSTISGSVSEVHATAFVRVDAATYPARWISDCKPENEGYGWTGRRMRDALNKCLTAQGGMEEGEYPSYRFLWNDGGTNPVERTLQSAFGGALLLPLHLFCETQPQGRWAPIGYPPTVFWTEAVGNGFSAGDIYQTGGQDYMLFPMFAVRKMT